MANPLKNRINHSGKYKNILIGVSLLGLGYFWGGLTVHKQIFPYEQIILAKKLLTNKHVDDSKLQTNPNWPERREQFELFGRQADVVMIGDSITHAGHWDDIFPSTKIANRGIARDRTDDIIKRIDAIISVQPKKAFLMVGINDLNWGRSVDEIFNDYKKIVTTLQNNKIQVFIQSTLECRKKDCKNKLEKVRDLNKKLQIYATQQHLIYININEGLTSEKEGLLSEYTYDGIHLRGIGYEKWSKTIAPYIFSL
jgi:lysophospholipase L1-like esterase